jgi:adenylate cyclase
MTELIRRHKKGIAAALIVISVFAGIGFLHVFGVFNYLEYKAYDFRVNFFTKPFISSKPSDDIIVVLLDQDSLDWANRERGWGWPWPRKAFADFVDYMTLGGAKSVSFDVFFSEPSIYRSANQDEIIDTAVEKMEELRQTYAQGENAGAQSRTSRGQRPAIEGYREAMENLRGLSARADDNVFTEAEKNSGRVVQTVFFSPVSGNAVSWPENLQKPLFSLSGFEDLLSKYSQLSGNSAETEIRALFPIEELRNASGAIGNVTGWPDKDGILRRTNLLAIFDGKAVPSLAGAALLVSGEGNALSYNPTKQIIRWGDYTIPVDADGRSILRFRGDIKRYVPYWANEVLQSAEAYAEGKEPSLPPGDFKDKHVFFGLYAPGLYDIFANPISSSYPGVGIHITMLDNILSQDFIREAPLLADMAILLAVIVIITLLVLFSRKLPLSLGGALIIIAGIVVGAFFFYNVGYWLPMVMPLAGVLASFITCYMYNYATEGKDKRYIKSAFSQYLSPLYIERIIANPKELRLGGERREITMFFSDVQGFTTISENLDPDQLKDLLNDYLTFLSDIIQDSGGTIDKYEGDAIIAFWNAPVSLEDHAARALGAALDCQTRLTEKIPYFEEKFRSWNITSPRINRSMLTRIGVNTGYAVVGNFGSEKHFNYTMLGDSVNLAARLEGLNKQFGTFIMCTDFTLNEAKKNGKFYGRKLAEVAVVGKNEPVTVWEPMTEAVFKQKEQAVKKFNEARDIFYQGNFPRAFSLFNKLKDQDSPAVYYADQCRYYKENPGEWQGFWKAMSK